MAGTLAYMYETTRWLSYFPEKKSDAEASRLYPFHVSYSHSIVPGGFDVMSYTTRLIPLISFTILLEMVLSTS